MALDKSVSTGVSDKAADVATSGRAGVSSAVKLVMSSCMLDSPKDTSGSGLTAGADTKTGLDTVSWANKDKLFELGSGAVASFSETETVEEGYEFTSFTVGVSSHEIIFTLSRANYKQNFAK